MLFFLKQKLVSRENYCSRPIFASRVAPEENFAIIYLSKLDPDLWQIETRAKNRMLRKSTETEGMDGAQRRGG